MRKLQNTLYISNENAYLTLDGENIVCKEDGQILARFPFDNLESIVCFSYIGCSPGLMGKCVEKNIPLNFVHPYGRFLAKVCGGTQGNVFLRVNQIRVFEENSLDLAKNTIMAKVHNCIKTIKRTLHDNPGLRADLDLQQALEQLEAGFDKIVSCTNDADLRGVEGSLASAHFSVFDKLILNPTFHFSYRTKRPPLDDVNALLSFIYTLLTNDCAAALETVGLDSYIGYYHKLRSGRESLACDMVEELRCIAERFVLTLINLKIVNASDFDHLDSGAVYLNKDGRTKVLQHWQARKRTKMKHSVIKETIPLGLLPYVQANLMAKYVRGDIKEYPCYLYEL